MYKVYEVFKSDGKRFLLFQSDDYFTCEVWVHQHKYDATSSVSQGLSYLVIELYNILGNEAPERYLEQIEKEIDC